MRNEFIADMKCPNCGGVPDSEHLNSWKDHHLSSQLRRCKNGMQCQYSNWSQTKLDEIWLNNFEFKDFILNNPIFAIGYKSKLYPGSTV